MSYQLIKNSLIILFFNFIIFFLFYVDQTNGHYGPSDKGVGHVKPYVPAQPGRGNKIE
jgi:hypothetical protein